MRLVPMRVVAGLQRLGRLRVLDRLGDLVAHEAGGAVVDLDAGEQVAPGGQEAGAADGPELLVALALSLVVGDRQLAAARRRSRCPGPFTMAM